MRLATGQARLLVLTIALAVAAPAELPSWTVADDDAPAPAVAVAVQPPGSSRRPSLRRAHARASLRAVGMAFADRSGEPDEGPDGWFPSLAAGLPGPFGIPAPIPARLGPGEPPRPRAPLSAGASCRLRC